MQYCEFDAPCVLKPPGYLPHAAWLPGNLSHATCPLPPGCLPLAACLPAPGHLLTCPRPPGYVLPTHDRVSPGIIAGHCPRRPCGTGRGLGRRGLQLVCACMHAHTHPAAAAAAARCRVGFSHSMPRERLACARLALTPFTSLSPSPSLATGISRMATTCARPSPTQPTPLAGS